MNFSTLSEQELKVRDDRYVKDLRKHGEEMDLMTERMEDQIETLMKAYREELAQIEVGLQRQLYNVYITFKCSTFKFSIPP